MPPTTEAWKSYIASTRGFVCVCEFCRSKDPKMLKKIEDERVKSWMLCKEYHQKRDAYFKQRGEFEPPKVKECQDVLRLGKEICSEMEEGGNLFISKNICKLIYTANYCCRLATHCNDNEMAAYFEEQARTARLYME